MDKFEAMRVFKKVAELQSFTKAADVLNLPKATVSTSVQKLEELVGAKLLNRTTRQVQLTAEGMGFLEKCSDLLIDLDETESMFRSDASEVKGKVRVDMVMPMAREIFLPNLPKFLEKYPGIEIELSSTSHRVDLIREGIDCVIRGGNQPEPGLAHRDLGVLTQVNCASPAYLAKYGKPKNLEDLKKHKLIFYNQVLGSKPEGFEYFDGEKYREIKMDGIITVNNADSYPAACLAGLGICQNPLASVEKYLKSGELIEVLPKFQAEPMKIRLVYIQRRMLATRVRVFMDWLEPVVKNYLK